MRDYVRKLLSDAILETVHEDPSFMDSHASEVAAVGPIYAHMYTRGFPGHRVDTEYDREGTEGRFKNGIDGGRKGSDRPDVLVHIRGHDDSNVLVVEFKLFDDSAKDQEKVRRMMRAPRLYKFGATVVLSHNHGAPHWRWFDSADARPELEPVPRL